MENQAEPLATKQIRRRTQRACDACRARKTKCFWQGITCRGCLALEIPCTQDRPRRKRGPPNRYVETQKQLGSPTIPISPSIISPSVHSTSPSELTSEVLAQLGPSSLVRQIIDDWFEFIHSVAPILHRGQFLSRLEADDALRDSEFCALVISVCAATVVSLKRRSCAQYGSVTLERCLKLVQENRLLEGKDNFSLEWCQAKYNFGSATMAESRFDDASSFRFMGEAVIGVKYLIFYELSKMPLVSQQLLKRLYWMLFAAVCTMDMFGRPHIGLLSHQDNFNLLRPLGLVDCDLDPKFVSPNSHWHGDNISYVPGLNFLSNLFMLWHSSQQDHNKSIDRMQEHIVLVQRALDDLPAELRWRGGLSRPPRSNFGTDVQVANLYITQLHIRSNLLEQLDRLSGGQSDVLTSQSIASQRQSIVEDALEILSHMPRETLEANGHSLVPKIRDVGAALLDEVRMTAGSYLGNEQAREDLRRLLEKLGKLDFRPVLNQSGLEC